MLESWDDDPLSFGWNVYACAHLYVCMAHNAPTKSTENPSAAQIFIHYYNIPVDFNPENELKLYSYIDISIGISYNLLRFSFEDIFIILQNFIVWLLSCQFIYIESFWCARMPIHVYISRLCSEETKINSINHWLLQILRRVHIQWVHKENVQDKINEGNEIMKKKKEKSRKETCFERHFFFFLQSFLCQENDECQ